MKRIVTAACVPYFDIICEMLGIEENSLSGPLALLLIDCTGIVLSIHSTPGNPEETALVIGQKLESPTEGTFPQLPANCRKCAVYVERLALQETVRNKEQTIHALGWVVCLCPRRNASTLYQGILRMVAQNLLLHLYCDTFSDEAFDLLRPGIVQVKKDTETGYAKRHFRRKELTREEIQEALEKNRGHRDLTAETLGISRTTLYRKMLALGMLVAD